MKHLFVTVPYKDKNNLDEKTARLRFEFRKELKSNGALFGYCLDKVYDEVVNKKTIQETPSKAPASKSVVKLAKIIKILYKIFQPTELANEASTFSEINTYLGKQEIKIHQNVLSFILKNEGIKNLKDSKGRARLWGLKKRSV